MVKNILLGFVNFDKPSPQGNMIEVLVVRNKIQHLRLNRFVKIENSIEKEKF